MYKEIIITVVIVVLVIIGDVLTQKYTEKCVDEINGDLDVLRQSIIEEKENEEILSGISEIENSWKERQKKLVYYLEHDELEKVTTQIFEIKGYIEIGELEESVPKIDNCKFLLNHIKDKEAFNFKNIF